MKVARRAEALLPTEHGVVSAAGYVDEAGVEHLALVAGEVAGHGILARVHSECLTGDVLGSARCDCRAQLVAALQRVAAEGGVVVYLRGHEGRGAGLTSKLEAYALQDAGMDTVDANLELGLDADARSYEVAAAILQDLGVLSVRLMTNSPDKVAGLRAGDVEVDEMVPLVAVTPDNRAYLETKAARLGHIIDLGDDAPGGTPA